MKRTVQIAPDRWVILSATICVAPARDAAGLPVLESAAPAAMDEAAQALGLFLYAPDAGCPDDAKALLEQVVAAAAKTR